VHGAFRSCLVLAAAVLVSNASADDRRKEWKAWEKDRREAAREADKDYREAMREREKQWREYLKEQCKADKGVVKGNTEGT
jgi:hypothetical protein